MGKKKVMEPEVVREPAGFVPVECLSADGIPLRSREDGLLESNGEEWQKPWRLRHAETWYERVREEGGRAVYREIR